MQTTTTTSADSSSSSNAPSSMHGCIAAYVEAEIDKRGMRKRVQRLRSLRKTGEAFETTFRLLEDCESALGIEEKEEEGGSSCSSGQRARPCRRSSRAWSGP